jgi:polysaccharide deacetylase family protein (PEP-CTERM system associated)
MAAPIGLLTLDVEDWYHANFSQLRGREAEIRGAAASAAYAVEKNIEIWLDTLERFGARSTCFVLGEFAKAFPETVRRIHARNHEVASHGMTHDLIYEMRQLQFREWLAAALGMVGELTGRKPIGFRAPSWSVNAETPWFCEELERAGIRYDSSEFPVRTPLYGAGDSPTAPYKQGSLVRIPVAPLELMGARIPFSSGAFFRLAPLAMIRFGLRRVIASGRPAMIVLHPRELDPAHPRLPLRGWERWVHYGRLRTTLPKLEAVLGMMRWDSIESRLDGLL